MKINKNLPNIFQTKEHKHHMKKPRNFSHRVNNNLHHRIILIQKFNNIKINKFKSLFQYNNQNESLGVFKITIINLISKMNIFSDLNLSKSICKN